MDIKKHYASQEELEEKAAKAVSKLREYVGSTMGPRGRNVILRQKDRTAIVTKDGVTVARFFESPTDDPTEKAVVDIVKQASEETNSEAGDGTTTAIVLADALYERARRHMAAGISPIELKRGIDKAVEKMCAILSDLSTPIKTLEDIEDIAKISANGDEVIGKLIAEAVDMAGKDGAISVKEGRSLETTLEVVEGFRFQSGIVAPVFITDERSGALKYEKPFILVTDEKIDSVPQLMPILEQVAREDKPLVIVAQDITGQALAALAMNVVRGSMKIAPIKAPGFGQERINILHDLAVSVGATFVSEEHGKKLEETTLADLGSCESIESTRVMTTVVGGNSDPDKLATRISVMEKEIEDLDDIRECERIQERINRLVSGVAIINVGGLTEVEMIEKKHRIEDSLEAVKSAQKEGIVSGGGTALIRAASLLNVEVSNEEQEHGVAIVKAAAEYPLRQIVQNCGGKPDVVVNFVKDSEDGMGWDAASEKMVNMLEAGIVDPAKVTKTALRNAASVVGALMTSGCSIVED